MQSPRGCIASALEEAMYGKLGATVLFLVTTLWAQNALAFCFLGFGDCGGGGGGGAVPEMDATGALAVLALLGGLVTIFYRRARR
jgi:hypothetical protein